MLIKRIVLLLVSLLLCLGTVPALASDTDDVDLFSLMETMYRQYTGRYELLSFTSEQDGMEVTYICPQASSKGLISSAEYTMPVKTKPPTTANAINKLMQQLIIASRSISAAQVGVSPFDEVKYCDTYGEKISLGIPSNEWWHTQTDGDTTIYLGPVFFQDGSKNILDDAVYIATMYFTPESTQLWLLSEPDLVCHVLLYAGKIPTTNETYSNFLREWIEDMREYVYVMNLDLMPPRGAAHAEDALAKARARISALPVFGTVTVTESGMINLRNTGSKDGDVVGKASPGEVFDVVGIADSGWYEVIIGYDTAFISNKVVLYTPMY